MPFFHSTRLRDPQATQSTVQTSFFSSSRVLKIAGGQAAVSLRGNASGRFVGNLTLTEQKWGFYNDSYM
jgi:hypothetical protein